MEKIEESDSTVFLQDMSSEHLFKTLLHLEMVQNHNFHLKLIAKLQSLDKPVKISVFVTPTCPYCPRAALTAHNMALASDMVTAEVIEANEFFDLSEQFGVSSVPHIAINRNPDKFFIGAYPEPQFLQQVLDLAE